MPPIDIDFLVNDATGNQIRDAFRELIRQDPRLAIIDVDDIQNPGLPRYKQPYHRLSTGAQIHDACVKFNKIYPGVVDLSTITSYMDGDQLKIAFLKMQKAIDPSFVAPTIAGTGPLAPGTPVIGATRLPPAVTPPAGPTTTTKPPAPPAGPPATVIPAGIAPPAPPAGLPTGIDRGWGGLKAEKPPMSPGQRGLWVNITNEVGFTGNYPLTLTAPVTLTVKMNDGSTRSVTLPAKTYPDGVLTDGGSAGAVNGIGWQLLYEGLPPPIIGTMLGISANPGGGSKLWLRYDVLQTSTIFPVSAVVAPPAVAPVSSVKDTTRTKKPSSLSGILSRVSIFNKDTPRTKKPKAPTTPPPVPKEVDKQPGRPSRVKKPPVAVDTTKIGAAGTAAGWTSKLTNEPPMTPGQVGFWVDITQETGYHGGFPLRLSKPVTITVMMNDGSTRSITIPAKLYPDASATDGGSKGAPNGLGWQIFYNYLNTGFVTNTITPIIGTMLKEDACKLYLRVDVMANATAWPVAALPQSPPLAPSGQDSGWHGSVSGRPPMPSRRVGLYGDLTDSFNYSGKFPITLNRPVTITVKMSDDTVRELVVPAKTYPDASDTDGGRKGATNGLAYQMKYDGYPPPFTSVMVVEDKDKLWFRIDVQDDAKVYPIEIVSNIEGNCPCNCYPADFPGYDGLYGCKPRYFSQVVLDRFGGNLPSINDLNTATYKNEKYTGAGGIQAWPEGDYIVTSDGPVFWDGTQYVKNAAPKYTVSNPPPLTPCGTPTVDYPGYSGFVGCKPMTFSQKVQDDLMLHEHGKPVLPGLAQMDMNYERLVPTDPATGRGIPWPEGAYVLIKDGEKVYFDGDDFVPGRAPAPKIIDPALGLKPPGWDDKFAWPSYSPTHDAQDGSEHPPWYGCMPREWTMAQTLLMNHSNVEVLWTKDEINKKFSGDAHRENTANGLDFNTPWPKGDSIMSKDGPVWFDGHNFVDGVSTGIRGTADVHKPSSLKKPTEPVIVRPIGATIVTSPKDYAGFVGFIGSKPKSYSQATQDQRTTDGETGTPTVKQVEDRFHQMMVDNKEPAWGKGEYMQTSTGPIHWDGRNFEHGQAPDPSAVFDSSDGTQPADWPADLCFPCHSFKSTHTLGDEYLETYYGCKPREWDWKVIERLSADKYGQQLPFFRDTAALLFKEGQADPALNRKPNTPWPAGDFIPVEEGPMYFDGQNRVMGIAPGPGPGVDPVAGAPTAGWDVSKAWPAGTPATDPGGGFYGCKPRQYSASLLATFTNGSIINFPTVQFLNDHLSIYGQFGASDNPLYPFRGTSQAWPEGDYIAVNDPDSGYMAHWNGVRFVAGKSDGVTQKPYGLTNPPPPAVPGGAASLEYPGMKGFVGFAPRHLSVASSNQWSITDLNTGAIVPPTLADLKQYFTGDKYVTSGTAWPSGDYVLLNDGSNAYWNGTDYVAGKAP